MAMSSKERMLAALEGKTPDFVPCAFMIFAALKNRCKGTREFIERQLELGLDTIVDLSRVLPDMRDHADVPGISVRFGPEVKVREWREDKVGQPYPVLHKEYETPDGTLSVAVNVTDDWPHGDHVPFLDDYLERRCTKHLVTCSDDLPALRHLLATPSEEVVREARECWAPLRELAEEKHLLLTGGWGVNADALGHLCGLDKAILMAVDQPDFFAELLSIIDEWNRKRIKVFLDFGVDLFLHRGWYEGTSLWSPALYREFFVPILARQVEMVHAAGARFGYILTSGSMPLLDELVKLGLDVLIGVDPIQDHSMDMSLLKEKTRGRFALWGGVNGFLTVERGSSSDVEAAVKKAIETLGPDGFILSPVDNVRDMSDAVWANVESFIEAWKRFW